MRTKKKEEEIRFQFASEDQVADEKGHIRCDICYFDFPEPDVEIMLRGYTVCPGCVLSGPAAVAADAERTAGNKVRLAQRDKDPDDQRDVAADLRVLVKQLRRVDSFGNIAGGPVALAIARATAKGGLRRRRKAA
jgi:hypothetical protein